MRVFAVALAIASLAVLSCVSAARFVPTVTFCNSPTALLHGATDTIYPPNIMPGQNLTVTIRGNLIKSIQTASAQIIASFDGIPLYHKTLDLCKEAEKAGKKLCPAAAGPFEFQITHNVPNIPIHGAVKLHAVASDQSSNQIVCVDVAANL